MFEAPQEAANTLQIVERRARARLQPTALIFLDLGGANGGFVYNIAEDGMALSAAVPVFEDQQVSLRMQFPESEDWIEAQGRVIWKSKSKKEVGVDFVDLSEEARKRIRSFMLSEGVAVEPRVAEEVVEPAAGFPESGDIQDVREVQEESSGGTREEPGSGAVEIKDSAGVSVEGPTVAPITAEMVVVDSVVPAEAAGPAAQAGTESDQLEARETLGVLNSRPLPPSRPVTSKRRAHPRVRIVPLGYLQLGEGNGGIALNISEGGVAISTAMALADDGCLPSVRLQFPDTSEWIKTRGEIVWISESKKEAGVRFVGLSETARQQIRAWVATQPPASCVQPEERSVLKNPDGHTDGSTSSDAATNAHALPSAPHGRQMKSPKLPVPAISEAGIVYRRIPLATAHPLPLGPAVPTKSWLQLSPRFSPIASGGTLRAARRTLGALVVAMCCLLLVLDSAFPRGNFWDKTKAAAAQLASLWRDKPEDPVAPSSPIAEPSTAASNKVPAAAESNMPLPPFQPSPVASRPTGTLKREPAVVVPPPKASKETASKLQARSAQTPPVQKPPQSQFARVAANINNQPVERAEQSANALPPKAPQLEAGMAAPTNLAPLSANESRPAAPAATKSAAAPAALPTAPLEIPTRPSGAVTIFADSYPSLRVNGKMAKKERNGASLQLGRLFSRVEPVYPEEAKQQGIQGDVKLHAVIDRHGAVENIQTLNGPPLLVAAALNAVRQWRYTQTLLAGKSVETEEDIEIVFRLRDAPGAKK